MARKAASPSSTALKELAQLRAEVRALGSALGRVITRLEGPETLAMVERLRAKGLGDEVVLAAMASVPRHLFVEEAIASRAYEDTALPISYATLAAAARLVAFAAGSVGVVAAGLAASAAKVRVAARKRRKRKGFI